MCGFHRPRRFTLKNNYLIFKHLDLITENIYFIVLNCQLLVYLCSHERQITNHRTRYLYHWTTFRLCV